MYFPAYSPGMSNYVSWACAHFFCIPCSLYHLTNNSNNQQIYFPAYSPGMSVYWLLYVDISFNSAPWACVHFFYLFKSTMISSLMVKIPSSSKSSQSQVRSMHTPFKTGPPTKKPVAISIAKANKTKWENINPHLKHPNKSRSSLPLAYIFYIVANRWNITCPICCQAEKTPRSVDQSHILHMTSLIWQWCLAQSCCSCPTGVWTYHTTARERSQHL